MPSFTDFSLQPATLSVLENMNITEPTPVQSASIPALLAGSDLVGQSATGSGKTLAYGLPLVERLASNKRFVQALVLVPTRELAEQVNTVINRLIGNRRLTTALLVGGKAYGKQLAALRYGAQIVVGTPGRVKDHIEQGSLVLKQTRICVLDEADQMLDIGFAPVIEEILTHTPETRQMALFSATMPDWVEKLEQKFLKDPVKVVITPAIGGESTIEQIAYQVPQNQKMAALCTLLQDASGESTLIFGRTKFGVEKLGQQLSKLGFTVGTLHGNKSQRAREDVLSAFRRGHVQTLLATNVAARGLDIQGIYQVINYELPESSDLFTHRVGRTGRMGRHGKAITLLVPADISKWRRMARSLGQEVPLQKLTINEAVVQQSATPQTPALPEHTQFDAPQPARSRRPAAPIRENAQFDAPQPVRSRKPAAAGLDQEPYHEQWPARDRQAPAAEQEFEPYTEQRPARSRKPSVPAQDRSAYREQRPARSRKPFAAEQEYSERPNRERRPFATEREFEQYNAQQLARGFRPIATEQEFEPYREQRPTRGRRAFSPEQGRSGYTERAPEGNRAGAGKPSSFTKAAGKRNAVVTTEAPQHQTSRKRSAAGPAARAKRTAEARRSASR
jgi:ATP-dependent RNA helicase DeaD